MLSKWKCERKILNKNLVIFKSEKVNTHGPEVWDQSLQISVIYLILDILKPKWICAIGSKQNQIKFQDNMWSSILCASWGPIVDLVGQSHNMYVFYLNKRFHLLLYFDKFLMQTSELEREYYLSWSIIPVHRTHELLELVRSLIRKINYLWVYAWFYTLSSLNSIKLCIVY